MEGRDLRGREVSCECVCLGTTLPVFFVVVVVFGGAIIVHAFGLKMLSVFFVRSYCIIFFVILTLMRENKYFFTLKIILLTSV